MKRFCVVLATAGLFLATPALAADCDYDGDGLCDGSDRQIILDAVGSQEGDDRYVEAADHDGDGIISMGDVSAHIDLIR